MFNLSEFFSTLTLLVSIDILSSKNNFMNLKCLCQQKLSRVLFDCLNGDSEITEAQEKNRGKGKGSKISDREWAKATDGQTIKTYFMHS